MQDVPFKPRAYEKAAEAIDGLQESVSETYKKSGVKAVEEISGVGLSIAEKIEELLKTGHLKYYEELKKKTPVDLSTLTRVEGLGPKNIKKLYQKLGIKTLVDLEKAAKTGRIRNLEGFGEKSEEKILKGIEFLKKSGGRFVLGFATDSVREIEERLGKLPQVKKLNIAGSARRKKETIGDVDILVISDKSKQVMDSFVSMPEVARVFAHGETKSVVRLKNGMEVDLRVVPTESYGAALMYFTGSKDHNIAIREMAIKKGWKLNEYGLFKGKKLIAGRTEEEVYKKFGMDYIEPELRENTGEIELAQKHKLPELIGYDDLKGDLQIQTDWTDGRDSIEAMAKAAFDAGLEYIAITDHTKRLAMTNGLDEKRIKKQWAEIDKVNLKLKAKNLKLTVLKGTECDILKDGIMDLPDEILEKLDVVGASIHSHFNLPRHEQTKRIIRAMENTNVDVVFHLTTRVLNKREPIELDIDEIIKVAKRTGTILEIDAYPDRSDISDSIIRKCVDAGVKMSIDSDAHAKEHIKFLEFGIAQARRGWAKKSDIINGWPLKEMLRNLKR
ncbi:MAG: PHP domain protein [Parcubacteria group bacterium GW2011_GWB1_45_9]|nr:MAG: PHP domain protein [Parcubacteria group bacterium GW2011_GWB1_45_9]